MNISPPSTGNNFIGLLARICLVTRIGRFSQITELLLYELAFNKCVPNPKIVPYLNLPVTFSEDLTNLHEATVFCISNTHISGSMEVDTTVVPTPLSAELEQINQEITNAQITSQQITSQQITSQQTPRPSFPITNRRLSPRLPSQTFESMQTASTVHTASVQKGSIQSTHVFQSAPVQPSAPAVNCTTMMQYTSQTHSLPTPSLKMSSVHEASDSSEYPDIAPPLTPNVPVTQLPTFAQSSENLSTVLPHATQPIAEAPSTDEVKSEQPVPEVIEIKEEMDESNDQGLSTDLIPTDTLQQLMSSISGAEDNSGLQNFVPTATLSSLPPSFLDRSSLNPLSMVGSLNTGEGPGPSGINVPNISESMMLVFQQSHSFPHLKSLH